MQIIVCVKQVPDTAEVKISPETNTLIREGIPSIINPFDLHALEEGLRLREKHGGAVTVLTMGPPQAKEALREALALGSDRAVLLSDRAFAGADTLATSYTLARAVEKIGYDVILCGRQAIDGDTAQVGPGIAEHLGIPHVTCIRSLAVTEMGRFRVERMTDDGYETLDVEGPALFTVIREINTPRLPSLRGMMRAKKANFEPWTAATIDADPERIGLQGSPTGVVRIFNPPLPEGKGEIWRGSSEENTARLIALLRDRKII
ncbi:MAG: electron transfer flavoprotein subunit beta/FixA family protein [bacterium]|jgi:electron transfer flavoprotein beta subunit